jgi:O-antigen ligase
VSLYYLLLLIEQFHNYPRLGGTLFDVLAISVSVVKIVGLLVVVVALLLPRPRGGARRRSNAIGPLFCVFGAYALLGTVVQTFKLPQPSFAYIVSLLFLLIATRRLINTQTRFRSTIRTMVIAAAIASLWDFKQSLGGADRTWGVAGDSNYEALLLMIIVPLALWMLHHESSRRWRAAGGLSAAMLIAAALLTQSRGGLLTLPIIGLAELSNARRTPRLVLGLLLASALVLVLVPSSLWQRFRDVQLRGRALNSDQESAEIRFDVLIAGLRMSWAHPMAGVGLDRFKQVLPLYGPELSQFRVNNIAHNTYLQVGAEAGLPALVLFLGLMGSAFSKYRAVLRRGKDDDLAQIARAMRLALGVYAVGCFFLTAWYLTPFWLIVFLSQNLFEIAVVTKPQISSYRQVGLPEEDYGGLTEQRALTIPDKQIA